MGFFGRLWRNEPLFPALTEQPATEANFAVTIDPAMLYGAGYTSPAVAVPLSPRVSRREAMSVPAVKRSRDLIAGSLGTLPLGMIGPGQGPRRMVLVRAARG